MKKIFKFLLLLQCSLAPIAVFSQTTEFIPPSPQSFSFIKATNVISENEHTGSANVNIPLFNYRANKLTTDISILYSGAGVKVDDLPNDIGMTWVLDAGGVITRTVNGLIDEKATMRLNKSEAEIIQKTTDDCAADEEIRTVCYQPATMDSEKDIFDFRFSGVSGSFYLDANFVPVFLKNDDDVKISLVLPAGETNNRKFTGFEIITKDGIIYLFGGSVQYWETTASKAMPSNPPGDYAVTSFFLKQIEHLNGEKIYFSYHDTPLITNQISEIHSRYLWSSGFESGYMPNIDPELRISIQTHFTKNKKRIQQISNSDNNTTLNFIYSEKANSDFKTYLSQIEFKINNSIFKKVVFDYLYEDVIPPAKIQRLYLTQLNFYESNTFDKKYHFNYNDPLELPKRLSYQQDMYGYYNGKGGESLIAGFFNTAFPPSPAYQPSILASFGDRRPDFLYARKGTLQEVVYPTGGKTTFEYECPKSKAAFSTKEILAGELFSSTTPVTKVIENLHFSQTINYTLTTYSATASGTHGNIAEFEIRNIDTDQVIHNNWKVYGYSIDSLGGSFHLEQNKKYLITFKPRGSAELKFTYSHKDVVDDFGIRLKSLSHLESGLVQDYKRFYYSPIQLYKVKKEDLALGEIVIIPNTQTVAFQETHQVEFGTLQGTVFYSLHSSNNSSAMYNSKLQNRYSFVTCSIGGDNFEKGGYQKTFRKDYDDELRRISPAPGPGNLAGPPSTGTGYSDYIGGMRNSFGLMLNHLYFPAKGNRLSYSGTPTSIRYFTKRNGNIFKSKQTEYKRRYNILSSNPNLFVAQTFDDNTQAICGSTIVQRIAHFYFSLYRNYIIDTKLEKETNTDYIDGVPVTFYNNYNEFLAIDSLNLSESSYRKLITVTDYEYSGMPVHNQLTKQKISFSDNSLTETTYAYAHEKGNQYLIGKNMIGIPLETTVIKKSDSTAITFKQLAKTEIIYPVSQSEADTKTSGLALPYEVKSTDFLGVNSVEATYDLYDLKGNLLQYTGKNGIPTVIIWGYNGTQPIAKITGVDYDSLGSSLITDIVSASDTDATAATNNDETTFLGLLDAFRKHSSLCSYQITTYTYDPLIGVRSITPPSGIREVYLYDSANRLKEIRENNAAGKLIKEFKYNYKH